jgi:hypothetical protein
VLSHCVALPQTCRALLKKIVGIGEIKLPTLELKGINFDRRNLQQKKIRRGKFSSRRGPRGRVRRLRGEAASRIRSSKKTPIRAKGTKGSGSGVRPTEVISGKSIALNSKGF